MMTTPGVEQEFPVAGDVVTILVGHTVTLTADAACADATVNGTLTIGNFIFSLSGHLAGAGVSNHALRDLQHGR